MSKRTFLVLVGLVFILASCSKFRRIQKKGDWKEKYDAALAYYDEGEYYKASVLLEDILPIIRGTEYAERAEYVYAYSYFHQGQVILSAHYFQTFYQTFSRSEFAEEAMFMHAYSLYLDSPDHNLDQSSTYEAVNAMQLFLNRHPNSEFRDRAAAIIDDLQRKLEKKAYENAKQYYVLGRYKAAVIAFDNFRKDYPDSKRVEEIRYLKIKAQYKLAEGSIYSKKGERFRETIELYQEFLEDYPESEYLRSAGDTFEKSRDELEKLEKFEANSNF